MIGHILWIILKGIGILLLSLLGLLLLAALLFLFVPVRYRFWGEKTGVGAEGHLRASWLFHLFSVTADYVQGRGTAQIKLAWISLKRFGSAEKSEAGDSARRPSRKKSERKAEEARETEDISENRPEEFRGPEDISEDRAEEARESEAAGASGAEEPRPEKTDHGQTAQSDKKLSLYERILLMLEGYIDRIALLPRRAAELLTGLLDLVWALLWKLSDGADLAEEKLEDAEKRLERLSPFLDDTARSAYGLILDRLKRLARHYAPRRAEGYLHFGTGRADLTGYLTGALYLVFPARMQVSIEPEFTDTVFETELSGRGHIRACHLLWAGIRLILKKEIRILIRRIRRRK